MGQFLANSIGPSQDAVQRRILILPDVIGCLASGLSWAGGQNVRHNDLKPNNVLVLDNKALISDFGLATEFDHDSSKNQNPNPSSLSNSMLPTSLGKVLWTTLA